MSHVGGTVSHLWNTHIKPRADARYVNESQVKTVRGAYFIEATAAGANTIATDSISFGFTMPTAPVAHFINSGATPPAECPGTVQLPKALPGHLCVYEGISQNTTNRATWNPTGGGGTTATRMGVGLYAYSDAAGQFKSHGTWAVTTP